MYSFNVILVMTQKREIINVRDQPITFTQKPSHERFTQRVKKESFQGLQLMLYY